MDVELVPETPEQARTAFLAFASIVGGGVLAFEASRAIRDGDLFMTEPTPEKAEVGFVAGAAGLVMLGFMYQAAAKDVGWKPIILGSTGVFAAAVVLRAIRR